MLLYPLLATLAQAGGPSATKSVAAPVAPVKPKRNYIPTEEYVAITTFPKGPNGPKYCLQNLFGMAGLIECTKPGKTDVMSLFTFQPAPGKSQGQGYYVMQSYFDKLCVNFQKGANPLYLGMSKCDASGTAVPWFFQWNNLGKNPGTGSFANPKYSVISSSYLDLMNVNSLGANQCYYSNSLGGIDKKQCEDNQELTWFGYNVTTVPWNYPYKNPPGCKELHGNSNPLSHGCGKNVDFSNRFNIRGLYQSSNGQLLKSGTGLKGVAGLGVYGHAEVNFPITPHQSGGNITEFTLDLDGKTQAFFTIGFAAGTTKIEVKGTNLNSSSIITNTNLQMISSQPLPIGVKSHVSVKITSIGVSIKVNSVTVFTTTSNPIRLNTEFTSTISSPPIDSSKGTVKASAASATVGILDYYSSYKPT